MPDEIQLMLAPKTLLSLGVRLPLPVIFPFTHLVKLGCQARGRRELPQFWTERSRVGLAWCGGSLGIQANPTRLLSVQNYRVLALRPPEAFKQLDEVYIGIVECEKAVVDNHVEVSRGGLGRPEWLAHVE